MPKTIDINALRALYAKATPGSWVADYDGSHNVEELQDYVHLATDGPGHKTLFDTLNSDVRDIETDCDEDGYTYTDRTGRANMALVAALHEAAPGMWAEIEAARKLAARLRQILNGDGPGLIWLAELLEYERARDGIK